uniref:Uncharacterized protein n=1 Tax=Meloidogyne hapla TaxID=6305 RepID=A0A1I8BNX4_MELHA
MSKREQGCPSTLTDIFSSSIQNGSNYHFNCEENEIIINFNKNHYLLKFLELEDAENFVDNTTSNFTQNVLMDCREMKNNECQMALCHCDILFDKAGMKILVLLLRRALGINPIRLLIFLGLEGSLDQCFAGRTSFRPRSRPHTLVRGREQGKK